MGRRIRMIQPKTRRTPREVKHILHGYQVVCRINNPEDIAAPLLREAFNEIPQTSQHRFVFLVRDDTSIGGLSLLIINGSYK